MVFCRKWVTRIVWARDVKHSAAWKGERTGIPRLNRSSPIGAEFLYRKPIFSDSSTPLSVQYCQDSFRLDLSPGEPSLIVSV
jgi:hypothetical protein